MAKSDGVCEVDETNVQVLVKLEKYRIQIFLPKGETLLIVKIHLMFDFYLLKMF